ncbi:hypothetical protein ACJW30_04G127800 [Castanea mollissima]
MPLFEITGFWVLMWAIYLCPNGCLGGMDPSSEITRFCQTFIPSAIKSSQRCCPLLKPYPSIILHKK